MVTSSEGIRTCSTTFLMYSNVCKRVRGELYIGGMEVELQVREKMVAVATTAPEKPPLPSPHPAPPRRHGNWYQTTVGEPAREERKFKKANFEGEKLIYQKGVL